MHLSLLWRSELYLWFMDFSVRKKARRLLWFDNWNEMDRPIIKLNKGSTLFIVPLQLQILQRGECDVYWPLISLCGSLSLSWIVVDNSGKKVNWSELCRKMLITIKLLAQWMRPLSQLTYDLILWISRELVSIYFDAYKVQVPQERIQVFNIKTSLELNITQGRNFGAICWSFRSN